jgi:hypothetical protein
LAAPALAGNAAAPRLTDHRVFADYRVYAGGLEILAAGLDIDLGRAAYRIDLNAETTGMIGEMVSWKTEDRAEGVIADGRLQPRLYEVRGALRGKERLTTLRFGEQGEFLERRVVPSLEEEQRRPVPPEQLVGAMDVISGITAVMKAVAQSGDCNQSVPIFDGRRLFAVDFAARGTEILAPTELNAFSGEAVKCDVKVRVLAGDSARYRREGFRDNRDDENGGRTTITVWMASVTGGPAVPVKIQATSPFGSAFVHLAAFESRAPRDLAEAR